METKIIFREAKQQRDERRETEETELLTHVGDRRPVLYSDIGAGWVDRAERRTSLHPLYHPPSTYHLSGSRDRSVWWALSKEVILR